MLVLGAFLRVFPPFTHRHDRRTLAGAWADARRKRRKQGTCMPQIFRRRSNTIARASILGAVVFLSLSGWGLYRVYWSPYTTLVNLPLDQPVPFSHQHHVGGLGIDCRY